MNKIKAGDIYYNNRGYKILVLSYINSNKVHIEYQDYHKHRAYVSADSLRKGSVTNPYEPRIFGIGYLGAGKYHSRHGGKSTKEYIRWRGMLDRAYNKKLHEKNPAYKDCYICEEWHNFQNFAEWFYKQPNHDKKGFELDKDLIVFGNREYSEEKCTLVPKYINNLLNSRHKHCKKELPEGVSKKCFKYQAVINKYGKYNYLGLYNTPEEAHAEYLRHKRDHIIEAAEFYKQVLDKRVYDNLINWTYELIR